MAGALEKQVKLPVFTATCLEGMSHQGFNHSQWATNRGLAPDVQLLTAGLHQGHVAGMLDALGQLVLGLKACGNRQTCSLLR